MLVEQGAIQGHVLPVGQENPGAIEAETIFQILVDIFFQDVGPGFDLYDDAGLAVFEKDDIEPLMVEVHVLQ